MPALHLPIAEPCHEDWDAMDPEAQGRFCGKCTKSVHDLSSMEEHEARALLKARAGSHMCVRYEHDADGAIRFRRPAVLATALAGVALAACTPHEPARTEVNWTQPLEQQFHTPSVPVTPMAKAPIPDPVPTLKGEIAAPEPAPVLTRKGDIAVSNEPCEPPVVKVVEPAEPPVRKLMGKPMMPRPEEL
jgi:hypothetical protein